MRKFGINKKNPNPPWPNEQPVVVIPPGSNSTSVGMPDAPVRNAENYINDNYSEAQEMNRPEGNSYEEEMDTNFETNIGDNTEIDNMSQSNDSRFPLMGFMQNQTNQSDFNFMQPTRNQTGNLAMRGQTMGQQFMPMRQMRQSQNQAMMNYSTPFMWGCLNGVNVSEYMCRQIGKYVKIEFLFGEHNHIEKTGFLREVGRDFFVIQEAGTNSMLVCSIKQVKFISVYGSNNTERLKMTPNI